VCVSVCVCVCVCWCELVCVGVCGCVLVCVGVCGYGCVFDCVWACYDIWATCRSDKKSKANNRENNSVQKYEHPNPEKIILMAILMI
jgi:hypothetical protein